MTGIIPRPFIDDLLDRVDIVEIIDHRVKLKKAGKNYTACCPFHDEKTPSFTVSPDKQFYYCFGCGANGNAIGFLMEYERLSFPDAIENIANLLGLEVPREETQDPKQREREQAQEQARKTLYSLMDAANHYFQQQLRGHPQKQQAVDYLQRRGLTGYIARDFNIGFAPPGWNNLGSSLATSNEKQDRLLEAGMLIHNDEKDSLYDRFRDRIMFPIRDTRGRVIAFGGRVLGDDKPKYLNSPETPIFHKTKTLYGLFEAREAHKQLSRLLVVEGYMDVVALAQFDIRYGVATLGTACSQEHLNRAFRFTSEVVFCFDGDEAGRKAARRAMENALPAMEDGRQVKFLYLPEGEDPDTLVRQIGKDKFTRLIEGATPLESFLFEELSQGLDVNTMEGRARLCKLAAPLMDQLPRGVYRELMFNQLANRAQLSLDAVLRLLEELPQQAVPQPESQSNHAGHVNYYPGSTSQEQLAANHTQLLSSDRLEQQSTEKKSISHKPQQGLQKHSQAKSVELVLTLLMFQPKLASHLTDTACLQHSQDQNVKLLTELINLLHKRPEYTSGQILGFWQGTYGPKAVDYLQEVLAKSSLFHHITDLQQQGEDLHTFDPKQEFLDAIDHIEQQQQRMDCDNIIEQLNNKPIDTWTEAEKQLYQKAMIAKD
ncbi:MAG: DNA primase [Pseudomonadota bacterium]